MQMQYKAVAIEFLTAGTLDELQTKINEALEKDYLFHGDWKQSTMTGEFIQAMCPAAWRPVPIPQEASSSILVPQPAPGRILG